MSTTPHTSTQVAQAQVLQHRVGAYRARKKRQRHVRRKALTAMTSAPVTPEQRAYDPLEHGSAGGALAIVLGVALVSGAVLLHA
ncbi:MAG: hypothetical protein AAFX99_25705, partial [Myxococcota bacterium]